jgi:hypothetical protein
MSIDTTSLRELLEKWQAIKDLAPSSSTIFVGERHGILRCALQLEKVIKEIEDDGRTAEMKRDKIFAEDIEAAFGTVAVTEMDPYNTSADRPK